MLSLLSHAATSKEQLPILLSAGNFRALFVHVAVFLLGGLTLGALEPWQGCALCLEGLLFEFWCARICCREAGILEWRGAKLFSAEEEVFGCREGDLKRIVKNAAVAWRRRIRFDAPSLAVCGTFTHSDIYRCEKLR